MIVLITLMTASLFFLLHMDLFISYIAAAATVSFLLFSFDKLQAVGRRTRVPESSLIISILLGGFMGSFLSMVLFRHKIRKIGFWAFLFISLLCYGAIAYFIYF